MMISQYEILDKISKEFTNVYRTQSKFPNSGVLWNSCLETIKDIDKINYIILLNDTMQIPPVKTFLLNNSTVGVLVDDQDKKNIGAFWGFIFKNVFNYNETKNDVTINTKGVKKATYFLKPEKNVKVTGDLMEEQLLIMFKNNLIKNGFNGKGIEIAKGNNSSVMDFNFIDNGNCICLEAKVFEDTRSNSNSFLSLFGKIINGESLENNIKTIFTDRKIEIQDFEYGFVFKLDNKCYVKKRFKSLNKEKLEKFFEIYNVKRFYFVSESTYTVSTLNDLLSE